MGRRETIRARLAVMYGLLAFGSFVLIGRLVYLQVIDAPRLSALAFKQRTREINLSSVRGEILDRNGEELAVSIDAYSVYAHPSEFTIPAKEVAAHLAPVVGMPAEELLQELEGQHWRWILRQRDEKLGKAVRKLDIAGIGVLKEKKRVYPKGTLAAPLLGFVGVDNQGLAGIEHAFDKVLAGPPQKLLVSVDAYGRELLRDNPDSPLRTILTDGAKVTLTLDETLQHIAERELEQSIKKLDAKRGAALVMDPQTGDILAFAIQPSYDPNAFEKASWAQIKNWAVSDVYEPGSTMKLFTIAAALEAGKITPRTLFPCGRSIKIQNRTITDHEAPRETRMLDPFGILEISSNIGTVQIGLRMPARVHYRLLRRLGFGEETGSGITGEVAGLMPRQPWRQITQATITFGQGISVTPLQILNAACVFANGGVGVRPRLISRVVSPEGDVLQEFPTVTRGQVVSAATAKEVLAMLRKVVETGTGTAADVPGYHAAGKTGTAQRIREDGRGYSSDVIASFLGFVPYENPRLAILTILDSPRKDHWAASTAAPLFRQIAQQSLQSLGVKPTAPLQEPKHETTSID